jgi:hypothetical protein
MQSVPVVRPSPAAEVSAQVNPAGAHPRGVVRWGYFLVLNAIAGVIAVAMFVGVFYADSLDPYMRGTYDWLLAHPGVTSFVAFSPLASSLLVGWGYSQRARKRKAAAAAAAAAVGGAPAQPSRAEPARPAAA